jgi:predicted MFS family arabinose efflux permease
MISDYFPPQKRSTALSIYSTGIYFGILIGFLMGGYLNQHLGWRTAFFVVGIPGIIFSILFYVSVKEPRRGATDVTATSTIENQSLGKVLKQLYSTNTFVYLALATGLHVFCLYGLLNWTPSFLSRLHGMKNSEIGSLLGPIFGISGAIGSFAGGFLTDHFGKKDKRSVHDNSCVCRHSLNFLCSRSFVYSEYNFITDLFGLLCFFAKRIPGAIYCGGT